MNPTEPTTPQPKPADAAGLLPCPLCNSASERTPSFDLHRCCNRFCKLGQGHLLFTREEWLQLAAHTPHAAEAGVRAEYTVDSLRATISALMAEEEGGKDRRHLDAVLTSLLARHRTAAETVGTGELSLKALWAKFHAMWGDARAGRTYCKDDWMEMQAMVNKLTATPPATQSALEQALETAVGHIEWFLKHIAEGKKLLPNIEMSFPQAERFVAEYRAAVRTPAKGGADGLTDTQRLDYLLKVIYEQGTDGIGDLNWSVKGEDDEDIVLDRAAIDAAIQHPPHPATQEETE